MSALHAPAGGVSIDGTDYVGGQFIPADVADSLSDDQKAAVRAGQSVGGSSAPDDADEPESFAEAYMAHESHEDANDHYLDTLTGDEPGTIGDLTPDAEEAVADNLAQYSTDPDDWATTVVPASLEGGTDTTAARILLAAATKANIDPPPPFGPAARTYHVFDLDDLAGDDLAYAGKLLAAFRPVFASADGSRVVLDTTTNAANEMLDGLGVTATDLDDEDGLQKLFDHLADPSVRESDVPAAARNFGRVSGTTSGGVGDWDANAVDVYRPMSKTHSLLRRGNLNPDVAHGPKYEIVARADLPARSNLPPQFWAGLEATDPTEYDDTPASRKEGRADTAGGRRSAKVRLKAFDKQFGKLKDRHSKLADKIAAADAHSAAGGAANLSYHSDDSPHGEAAARLSDATSELSDATDHAFETPEFEAQQVRDLLRDAPTATQSDADSPEDYADALAHAADEAESSYGDHSDALAESEAEVGAHLASLRSHYRAVASAATDVIRTSRTHEPTDDIDPDQARENARQAVAALRLSRRMLKRLDRQSPEPKE